MAPLFGCYPRERLSRAGDLLGEIRGLSFYAGIPKPLYLRIRCGWVVRPGGLLVVRRWTFGVHLGLGKVVELALRDVLKPIMGNLIELEVHVTADVVEGVHIVTNRFISTSSRPLPHGFGIGLGTAGGSWRGGIPFDLIVTDNSGNLSHTRRGRAVTRARALAMGWNGPSDEPPGNLLRPSIVASCVWRDHYRHFAVLGHG